MREYVASQPETPEFLAKLDDLLALLLPAYVKEGKSYLSIAVGCTGGTHRSVFIAEELAKLLEKRGFRPMSPIATSGSSPPHVDGCMTRVVALGGGHGLAASLSAIRRYASDVTAIVSVADDGGSSGRLRSAFGIPPPGDLRRCLVALADADSLWADAFEHRFTAGELEGHALGNLMIAGLAATTGDFELALDEAGRLLGAVGRVIPATREPVVLKAVVRAADGDGAADVEGQVAVGNSGRIAGVWLVPADPEPTPAALDALAAADQVVIGPGSLFTSVLAVVAVPAIREALAATRARRSTSATCASRAPRPRATTSPPTSTPSGPTASRSTWCCAIRAPSPSEE